MTVGAHLGFDFGRKLIGIAVGSTASGQAEALKAVRGGDHPDWDAIDRLVREWQPSGLVVGLPLHMDGSEQVMTRAARRFGEALRGRYNLPIMWCDERLTTRVAHEMLAERGVPTRVHKRRVDRLAAQTILQAWLDGLGKDGSPGGAKGVRP